MKFSNPDIAVHKPIPAPLDTEYPVTAWGVDQCGESFKQLTIYRPQVGLHDVKFELKFCGICHSDVHNVLNEMSEKWGSTYPIVPGHELVGTVVEVGEKVSRVKVGDNVGVGCIRDSCLICEVCHRGEECYCVNGFTHTYNTPKKKENCHIGGNPEVQNWGGYSEFDVVHEHFIIKIPEGMPLEKAGPILCAGITMWSPLNHWGATNTEKKLNIGIVGIGGLGTMGIKLAAALGHRVVAISSSDKKIDVAKSKGAEDYVVSKDADSVRKERGKLDLIINTVSAPHDIAPYISMLKTDGTLVQLGCIAAPMQYNQFMLILKRISIAGSLIGGIPATQEVVDFCFKNEIYPDIELVEAGQLNKIYTELQDNNSAAVRYVLDIKKSLETTK
ncbi:NADP-dependent alcohol dehydrogenase C-like [Bolinopsis microptera]|uniref:NADP-dependent alcohol dehydrogenase C-like n=1 Tax=Bolinopsis microptera TaxID=2820187 RepID=UPI003078FC02